MEANSFSKTFTDLFFKYLHIKRPSYFLYLLYVKTLC